MKTYVIGDIHGCYYTMKNLIQNSTFDYKKDKIIFLGDYIDRGLNSYDVINYIKNLKSVMNDNCICLKGNHEQMLFDTYMTLDDSLWMYNGGMWTIKSFEDNNANWESVAKWVDKLDLYYEDDNYIYCHAGLTKILLKDNTEDELLWGRNWIDKDSREREKKVIFGHTPQIGKKWYITKTGDICIDGGSVFNKQLTMYCVEDNKFYSEPLDERDFC